jgi:hypothetical protein
MVSNITVPDESHSAIVTAKASAGGLVAQATAFVIDSPAMYEVGALTLTEIRQREKVLEEEREKIVKPMNTALAAVRNLFKAPAETLAQAKKILGDKMVAYDAKVKAEREAQEKAAADLRRKAQEEAESQMAEAEEKLKAGAISDEQFMAAASTASLAAIDVPVAIAAAPLQKMGHAQRKSVKAEVTSLPQLLRHIADSLEKGEKTFDNTVDIKVGQLNAFGKATQGSVVIPGVRWVEDTKFIARAG